MWLKSWERCETLLSIESHLKSHLESFLTFQESLMGKVSTITTDALVAGFHALSDPIRIQVLELLRSQELCVCELCEQLGVTHSKLSFHLKNFKEPGLGAQLAVIVYRQLSNGFRDFE